MQMKGDAFSHDKSCYFTVQFFLVPATFSRGLTFAEIKLNLNFMAHKKMTKNNSSVAQPLDTMGRFLVRKSEDELDGLWKSGEQSMSKQTVEH